MKRSRMIQQVLLVLTLGLTAPAAAEYTDGLAAYVKGDFATACKEFKGLADKGEAKAQLKLGEMHGKGLCGPQNDAEAAKWVRMAAEQGYAEAQISYGILNAAGNGVPQSDAEAANWFRKAAGQGNPVGQWMLGKAYEEGRGIPKSDDEAVKWYRRSAEQKNAIGQRLMGVMYIGGRSVPKDLVQAYMWLTLALENGNAASAEIRYGLTRNMTKEQIAEATRLAKEWKPGKGAGEEEKTQKLEPQSPKAEAAKDVPATDVKTEKKKGKKK